MKICPNCGAKVADNEKFCGSCGAQQPASNSTQNTQNMYNTNAGDNNGQNNYQYNNGGYYQPPMRAKTCGFSIASLVLSLIGIFTGVLGSSFMAAGTVAGAFGYYASGAAGFMSLFAFLFFLPNILAILFGIVGIIKTGNPSIGGRGMAIAGLILGIIFFIIWLAVGATASSMVFDIW